MSQRFANTLEQARRFCVCLTNSLCCFSVACVIRRKDGFVWHSRRFYSSCLLRLALTHGSTLLAYAPTWTLSFCRSRLDGLAEMYENCACVWRSCLHAGQHECASVSWFVFVDLWWHLRWRPHHGLQFIVCCWLCNRLTEEWTDARQQCRTAHSLLSTQVVWLLTRSCFSSTKTTPRSSNRKRLLCLDNTTGSFLPWFCVNHLQCRIVQG